jgi:hypothetical protein
VSSWLGGLRRAPIPSTEAALVPLCPAGARVLVPMSAAGCSQPAGLAREVCR